MKKIIFSFLLIIFVSFLVLPVVCFADTNCPTEQTCLPNPLGAGTTPEVLIGRVIQAILGVVGSLALLMFIYGGFTWMTASGNKEKVDKGKEIIIWATLGLVVIFTSYVLVKFVITSLTT